LRKPADVVKEQQQIEIARVLRHRTVEEIPDSLASSALPLAEAASMLALSREGKRARNPPAGKRSTSLPLALCELLDFLFDIVFSRDRRAFTFRSDA